MKTATVTLIRDREISPMMAKTFEENIRGVIDIVYTPFHVVFVLKNKSEVAYKADRIHEFETFYEEE
jgi:hypothetical protein